MRISRVESRVQPFDLLRPYTIAFRSVDSVSNVVLVIHTDDGRLGIGTGSPEPHVTGETMEAAGAALAGEAAAVLEGADVRELPRLARELARRMPATPAARAAADIALHDLLAQWADLPLARLLGQEHQALPTSITIGIKPLDETLAEADEYLGRGFRVLKVKLGKSLDEDLERLARLRERVGKAVTIRVDPNQGYSADDVKRFTDATASLDVEFLEQPMPVGEEAALRALPPRVRDRVALDESLLSPADALALVAPPRACGIFNIKLMKCGGVWPALRIAAIAETAGVELMWGCMDESIVSISAALHAAFASPATRYLDLDGSLDLAEDIVDGGFVIEDGVMRITGEPGLGVRVL